MSGLGEKRREEKRRVEMRKEKQRGGERRHWGGKRCYTLTSPPNGRASVSAQPASAAPVEASSSAAVAVPG